MKKTNLLSFANFMRWGTVANETHDSLPGGGYATNVKPTHGSPLVKVMRTLLLPVILMLFGSSIMAQKPGCIATDPTVWLSGDSYNAGTGAWVDKSPNNNGAVTRANAATDPDCTGSINGAGNGGITGTVTANATGMNFNPTVDQVDGFRKIQLVNGLLNLKDIYIVADQTAITGGASGGDINSLFYANNGNNELGIRNSTANGLNNWSLALNIAGVGGTFPGTITQPGTNLVYVTSTGASDYSGTCAAGKWFIGGAFGFTSTQFYRPFNGKVAEIILNNGTAHTAVERTRIQSYLAAKYGLTLPSDYVNSTATYWSIATNAGYNNDVTVLGKETCQGLDQKQSTTYNGTFKLVLGAGATIAASNAFNTGILTNNTYMATGNDGGATIFSTAYTAVAGFNYRMTRIWKVQETGTVGVVRVAIPTASMPAGAKLIVSTTSGLASPTVITSTGSQTINTIPYTYYDVDFADGNFFSFAAQVTLPGGVAGAALWVRADDGAISSDNTGKTAWANQASAIDLGGSGTFRNDAANLLNFNPIIAFNGANSYSANFLLGRITGNTNFAVVRCDAPAAGNVLFNYGSPGGANRINVHLPFSDGHITWDFQTNAAGNGRTRNLGNSSTQPLIWTFLHGDAILDSNTIYLNGILRAGVAGSFTLNNAITTFDGDINNAFSLGSNTSSTLPLTGSIPEFITFARGLTLLERQKVQSYLALKYGQTLASANNYFNSNGIILLDKLNYNGNTAGIGRDDISALYQKQSRNQNIGANNNMITMYLGSPLAATNQLNNSIITADLSHVLWGNNIGSATTTRGITHASLSACAERINRLWRVQRTGTGIGAVNMDVNLSLAVDPTGFLATDIKLAIDRDGDGDFATGTVDIITASSINTTTKTVTFTGINWNNDNGAAGTDVFAIVFDKVTNNFQAALVANGSSVTAPLSSCNDAAGYIKFVDNVTTPTVKYASINPNGNTGYSFTVTASNNSPTVANQMRTNGATATTALVNRFYTITTPGGPFTTNGGMKVRIYYSSADSSAAVAALDPAVTAGVTSTWFKVPGTVSNILADQQAGGILNATYLSPTLGIENGVKFAEFTGITTFSTFGYVAAKTATVLPVALSSFTAKVNDCKTQLNWVTTQELNSAYYEVEYSTTGNDYAAIGKVTSRNSATGASYAYTFANPQYGKGFYRLKMVKSDGKFAYSTIATATANCTEVNITFTPNPVKDILTIRGAAAGSQVQVYTATGSMVTKQVTGAFVTTINTSGYAAGTYMVRVLSNGVVVGSAKVLKH